MRDANKLHLLAHIATRLAEESAAAVPSESRLQFYESWFDEFLDWHFSNKLVPVVLGATYPGAVAASTTSDGSPAPTPPLPER